MSVHKPVLLKESIEALNLKEGDTAVDATLGGGGHTLEILEKIGSQGTLVAIDWDSDAVGNFKKEHERIFSEFPRLIIVRDNFVNIKNILAGLNIKSVNGILADLGYSSNQMEDASRGLSFRSDGPLDMRMDRSLSLTAKDVVNTYSEKELEDVIKRFGEERYARKIAAEIVKNRKLKKIETTGMLSEIIFRSVPSRYKRLRIHPATRTFQALRIEVNKELENLTQFISQATDALFPGGRLAIISFHSLEDRIVKRVYKANAGGCICPGESVKCGCDRQPRAWIITKKPITPGKEEVKMNPRARSAKLRVCEKL